MLHDLEGVEDRLCGRRDEVRALGAFAGHVHRNGHIARAEEQVEVAERVEVAEVVAPGHDAGVVRLREHLGAAQGVAEPLPAQPGEEGAEEAVGGLVEEAEVESRSQVPILGSIPVLGSLFSSTKKTERKTELVIYVTPHISYGEAFQNVSIPKIED